jgi:hypothetical protein
VSDDSLLGKAQSLLDALREKGLHLPNPTRVDGDSDAVAALTSELRLLAAGPALRLSAQFGADGALEVRWDGADSALVATVEARAWAPWRAEPQVLRYPARTGDSVHLRLDRDGPVNVVLFDVAGVPLVWCAVPA